MSLIVNIKSGGSAIKLIAGAAAMVSGLWCGLAFSAQNGLTAVNVSSGQTNSQVIKIQFKEDYFGEPVTFTTSNPNRLVLDFANTDNALGRKQEELNLGVIKGYQAVQSGGRTRLVINLSSPATYEIKKIKNMVLAILSGAVETKLSDPSPISGKPAGGGGFNVRDVAFKRGKSGEANVAVMLSSPGVGVDIQRKGKTIQVDFMNAQLPSPLQRRMDVSDFGTPVELIETFARDNSTRMVITPRGKWDYYAYQTGEQFILEVKSLEETAASKSDRPIYSGEKLSLNFQNVDVRAVLQVIADFTGLNIVASDSVKGSLTLTMKDVPWDQALDIIMRSRGLDKRVAGNVIWIAPMDELLAKEKAELEAKLQLAEIVEVKTESVKLNYLRAQDAYAMLIGNSTTANEKKEKVTCSTEATGVGGGKEKETKLTGEDKVKANSMLSKRGTANFDLKTNTLFVQDTPTRLEKIKQVLSEIDNPAKQVMIEARVVLADEGFSRTLGARLGFKAGGKIDGTSFGFSSNANDAASIAASGLPGSTTVPFNVDLPGKSLGAPTSTLGIGILNAAGTAIIGLELQALEADQRGKIVSNPRVITQNQSPAVILQGQQIPYTTADTAGSAATNTTEFVDALLCLLVDPQVLNNEDIILDVEVQKDAPGESTSGAPPIDRRRVKTQVRVKNGETAVLGGIFEQTTRNDTNKVPFLGDLPVLGALFRNNYKTDEKTELMIFLTPRLIEEGIGN